MSISKKSLVGACFTAIVAVSGTAHANFVGEIAANPRNINGAVPGTDTFFNVGVPLSGRYASSLSYSTGPIMDASGAPATPGTAFASLEADLRAGTLRVFAQSNLPRQASGVPVGELQAVSSIEYTDTLTVVSDGRAGAFVSFQLAVNGTSSILPNGFYKEVSSLNIRTDQGGITQRSDTYVTNTCAFAGCGQMFASGVNGAFASAVAGIQYGGTDILTVRIPISQLLTSMSFDVQLQADVTNATVDLSHTAILSMTASAGVSVQNLNGTFLTPVPEASTFAMLLGGIGVIFGARRQRHLAAV